MVKCHVVFFPFTAYGHMIPMADMAVLFAAHGVQTTIITTQSNAHRFSKSIQKTINFTHKINLHIIDFKAVESRIPAGIDSSGHGVPDELLSSFFDAINKLQEPVEQFVKESNPNCIVSDMFYPWTTKIAAKFNIPRIVSNGSGFFPMCVTNAMRIHDPARTVLSDSESFIVLNLPHEIKLSKKQLPSIDGGNLNGLFKVVIEAMEAEVKSYGVIFNSFYELEPDYVRYYREVMTRKAWHVGPVSLCNKNIEDKSERGRKDDINEHDCLKWLDSKAPDSVVYVSFGTMIKVTISQVYEIAMGLEVCNRDFIWVIKGEYEKWLPEGFEERLKVEEKGLMIKGWAPQVLILDHESVGGFVTHCGWNSVLEGVTSGVAMVTWPVMAEQLCNAKLVTDVLKIGVSIGDVAWSATSTCEGVTREDIEKAVARVLSAKEGEEMRKRARILKEKAMIAIEEGGSSYSNLKAFIEDIKSFKSEQ